MSGFIGSVLGSCRRDNEIKEYVNRTHDRDINAAKNILKYNSARNVENSRGVVNKPNERTKSVGDCSNNKEATNELNV